jgi:Zn-dependent protease with chaperone function
MTKEPARSRVNLPGISSRAWEHPADRGALVALRKLKGFDNVLKAMSGLFNERAVRLAFLGSAIRVDERQFSRLHALLADVARILDAPEMPELFVSANPVPNALTVGMNKPFIVISSGLVDLLDDEEMRFVLAHELGHSMSGHAVYQTLLQRLIQLSGVLNTIPMGGLGVRAIMAALMEWSRKAELSADRAGLLATQDPPTAFRVHMQLASGGHLEDLDPTSFFAQGQEYDDAGDLRDSVLKLLLIEARSHPFAVVRAAELRRWVESGEYTRCLSGEYPRRDSDAEAGVSEAAKAAARSYSETFRQSQDAVGKLVHDAAGFLGSAKLWLDDVLRRGEE